MAPFSGMPPRIGAALPPLPYGPDGWGPFRDGGGSFGLWRRARRITHITMVAMIPSTARPPTTPPTMAPTGVEEPDEDGGFEDVWAGLVLVSVGV